jgi:hypothetical protein
MQARRELQYQHINANGTTTIAATAQVANFLGSVVVGTPGTAGTITIYDGRVAGGIVVAVITLAANLPNNLPFDCYLNGNAGMDIVAAGFAGSPDVTITYGTKV